MSLSTTTSHPGNQPVEMRISMLATPHDQMILHIESEGNDAAFFFDDTPKQRKMLITEIERVLRRLREPSPPEETEPLEN